MSATKAINCTGELRSFLANMMVKLDDPGRDLDVARTQIKGAQQINESFYAEAKLMLLQADCGHKVAELGKLPLAAAEAGLEQVKENMK